MRAYLFVILAILLTVGCPAPPADSPSSDKAKKVEVVKKADPVVKPIVQRAAPNAAEPMKIAKQPLVGKINGEKWAFVDGKAKVIGGKLKIALYNQPVEGCGDPADLNAPSILLPDQQLEIGKGDYSFEVMAGFKYRTDKPHNDFAVKGKWRIDTAGPKTVSGGLAVDYRNHFVNGTFTVPLCE